MEGDWCATIKRVSVLSLFRTCIVVFTENVFCVEMEVSSSEKQRIIHSRCSYKYKEIIYLETDIFMQTVSKKVIILFLW